MCVGSAEHPNGRVATPRSSVRVWRGPTELSQIGGADRRLRIVGRGQSWPHTVRYDCGPRGLRPADSRLSAAVGATRSDWKVAPGQGAVVALVRDGAAEIHGRSA